MQLLKQDWTLSSDCINEISGGFSGGMKKENLFYIVMILTILIARISIENFE